MPKIVDRDKQRRELSAAAARVVAKQGLEHTTLRSVADAHGCTKGMVQHYFVDKEALLSAALDYVEDRCAERAEAAAQDLEGLAQLQARLQAQLPLKPPIEEEWRVRLAFNTRAATCPAMRDQLSTGYQQQLKAGVASLRSAARGNELREGVNLRNSYRSLLALVYGLGVGAVMDPGQLPAAAQRQILKRAVDDLRR